MVVVYSIALVIGLIGLIVLIFGGALAESLERPERDPGERLGPGGKMVMGAVAGFGMGGLAAEFSPLDIGWPLALVIALVAAGISILWIRYSLTRDGA
jgi:ABC-type antimicrobial peptide transport system permease subunit